MSIRRASLPALLVSSLMLSSVLVFSHSVNAQSDLGNAQPAIATASLPSTLYLPLVSNRFPLETVFGVEMNQITTDGGLDKVVAANTTWVRRNGVLWADIESNEGTRDWSVLAGLEQELRDASANNLQVILIVRKTPSWAQKVPGYSCGPIKPEKLGAFGNFMYELVSRYSHPPYNVKYWEIWNEPDVAPEIIYSPNFEYGCWGDAADPYYGGGYYADMLKVVYPRIKAADPQSQVLIGGLLLDCDPRPGAGCAVVNHDDKPPRFFEGILRHNGLNDGSNYFDGVSFHNYDDYYGQLGYFSNANWQSSWNTTGPVLIAKTRFIRNLLSQYGVSDKFLMNTETAMICGTIYDPPGQPPCDSSPASTFEQTKAYYLTQVYAAAIAEGLRADIWYSVLGWLNSGLLPSDLTPAQKTFMNEFIPNSQNSGLLTSSGAPRPAYSAYQFARSVLMDASFVEDIGSADIGGISGVKGYKFNSGNRIIWLLWSLDGNSHTVTFPSAPLAAWDALGNSVIPATSMNVNVKPLYLEWNP